MVLYKVYSEPSLNEYYSTVLSRATLFQVLTYVLLIIPPFFIAYGTNEFWEYTSSYQEQPDVNYLNQLFVQIGGRGGVGTGSISTWSSFPNLNLLLQSEELVNPVIKSCEEDTNRDGKKDILHLTITFTDLGYEVQTVKLLLFLNLQFTLFSSVTLPSLVYLSESWAAPAYRVWIGGELGLVQRVPFPARERVSQYNTSLFNSGGQVAEDFQLRNILSQYNRRNVTTSFEHQLVVWDAGRSSNFSLELDLVYPTFSVLYRPGFWQLLKFAWIQYLAIFVILWWIMAHVRSFVFQNQVILAMKKKHTKME